MIVRFSCIIFLLLPLAIDPIVQGKPLAVLGKRPGYVFYHMVEVPIKSVTLFLQNGTSCLESTFTNAAT